MTADIPAGDWSELAALIDLLLDAAPERRAALIAELSAGNVARQAELERLLAECEREPELLSRPAAERFAALFDDDAAQFPPALAERYRLTRELGRGGMATVYLAVDLKHGRDVAVKVVHPAIAAALGSERFLREIRIVAQLHHPQIVPLYDSGDAGGSLYFVMPYEEGASLRQRLERDGQLPVEDVVRILRDVCDALAYAHERGIVHRDIKPDNVLLAGPRALLTDFGVATGNTGSSDTVAANEARLTLGTPAYMAPEQVTGDATLDHRADIYALGALAYELLAGRPPFVGDSRHDVLSAQLLAAPVPIEVRRPDVPAPLAALVMKCLEKDPAMRWQGAGEMVQELDAIARSTSADALATPRRSRRAMALAATAGLLVLGAVAVFAWQRTVRHDAALSARWASARIERLTDFPGSEVDAAISADGQLVAFLADRDSVFDAYVTRVGSERFVNLTNGRVPQLFNEDVRNIGFSADAAHAWIRVAGIASPASISFVPISGGELRPFLPTAVSVAWSRDGSRLAYHETSPGDPIYVADRDGGNPRRVYVARAGIHCHHITWSPDGRFIYFARGLPPDEMDVWRVAADGDAAPEQVTHQDAKLAYPLLLDDRTLLYTSTADDGTGPWLYTMDLGDRVPHRLSTTVEHYISIAASAELPGKARRLVATVSNPSVHLWSVPITDGIASEQDAHQLALPTARAAAPRFAPDSSLVYLASRGGADALWRSSGAQARELWKDAAGAVAGPAAVSPDGKQVCFPVRRGTRTTLYCTTADGRDPRAVAESLDVRGAPSWSPDGASIAITVRQDDGVHIVRIPVAGGPAVRLVDSVSSNPVWSPDGRFILYSGTPRARSVPLLAVTPDGKRSPIPALTVDRVGDSYRFLPDGQHVVVKLGGFRRQDFVLLDLATGAQRPLTALRHGESIVRFDVAPDGKSIVFERMEENSDVVLIELPPR